MSEYQNQVNLPNESIKEKVQDEGRNIQKREAGVIIFISLLMASLYSACFTGTAVYPKLSFFVFCCVAVVVMYITFDSLNYLKNKRAFLWAVPICIISSFNAIFQLGFFTYTNVIIIHILFAVMGFSAVRGKEIVISELSGWIDILRICLGNIGAALDICRTMLKKRRSNVTYVIARVFIGIIIAIPVLLVITVFLIDADAVFKVIVNNMVNALAERNLNVIGHILCITIVTIYLSGYAYNLKHMKEQNLEMPVCKLDMIIGTTFLSLINLLFLFFCIVQMAFLFTGGYMSLPEDIVYSAYAREGFFQLLFVTIVNFGVIVVFLKLFPACVDKQIIKIMLGTLCVFTGILICSSFYRMSLYISAYGYTDIRMMVITFLAMEMVCVFITMAYLSSSKRDFLKQYLYTGLVFYILVNVTSNQFCVTSLNVNRFYKGESLDINQFYRNPDTVPILMEVVNTDIFQKTADQDTVKQAEQIIYSFKEYEDGRWQNWSFLGTKN